MPLNINAKLEVKLTCASKNGMRNFVNFHHSMFENLKIGTFIGSFYLKYKMCELKIYRGVMCHDNKEWCKIWRGLDLLVQNWHEEFDEFWPKHSEISKVCTLMGYLWRKYVMLELKKAQKSYVWLRRRLMQNLKETDLC